VAEAFVRALTRPASIGQTYELYGPDVLTLKQIVQYTAQCMGLRRAVLALPDALGRIQAALMDFMPGKPFSTDNFLSLQVDSVGGIDGLHRLGIEPTPISAVIPALLGPDPQQRRLDRFRRSRGA
ncbi:MAG: complex I NDUFA9 subunit family protein, partial [Lysobacteraceae bacterium]